MNNSQIADVFDEIADVLEFQNANQFRVRAYRTAARTMRDLTEPAAAIVENPDRKLTDIESIGKDLAEKITTLVKTGELRQHKELIQQVPPSVIALLRIPGLGPKRAAILHKELGIKSLDDVKRACEEGKVRGLKGFGEKTEKSILEGLSIASVAEVRFYWYKADAIAHDVIEHLRACKSLEKIEAAGSYRRGKETVGDLDFLVVSSNPTEVMDRFAAFAPVEKVLARGDTKMSVRVGHGLQIDLRVVPAESFGAALQYFTGSKAHNIKVRGMAKDRGLKINEWGVFRVHDGKETRVAGATEEEVYATLDLPWFPPEIREGRREFDWAAEGKLPELIELDDIRGDLHMHTTESDGRATLEEMAQAAIERGLKYIAITDHSKRVSMARGLDEKRLLAQWKQIDALNKRLGSKLKVLKGVECDILEKGGMDITDDVLAQADWVIGSIHYGQKQSREQITQRILGALENTHVDIVAHPTGRLINHREPYAVDMDAVFKTAHKHKKLLELNASPERLDLDDILCAAAKEHDVPIVISTDAHSIEGLRTMRYGVLQARRAGLTKKDVANTRTLAQFQKLLAK
jgi:DNA polymerase (family 10)